MNKVKSGLIAVNTFWALMLFVACQCDMPGNKRDAVDPSESNSAVSDSDPTGTGLTGKRLEEAIAQLQGLKKAHEKLDEKRMDLQKQFDAIPTEVKKNAVNCDQLEAQFDGHFEKSKMRIHDLKRIITSLENREPLYYAEDASDAHQQESRGEWERDVPLEVLMKEYRDDIPQIEAEFQIMAKAIEQLKASIPTQGKGVVLFQ